MRAYPTEEQKLILSQWMGASRVIWNAKCDQWKYESTYARKYMPIGTYAPIDQAYSQFKNDELTPYLSKVPSQILRNSSSNWYTTMRNWLDSKHPLKHPAQRKKKGCDASVHLTKELFSFKKDEKTGQLKLTIGTKKFQVGSLYFKFHRNFTLPNSMRIKKKAGIWWFSFCYDDGFDGKNLQTDAEKLSDLRKYSKEDLEKIVIGVDRGVKVAAQTNTESFDYSKEDKTKLFANNLKLKRYQKRMARQVKGSNRREKTKGKIGRIHLKIANTRENFCHQTSHKLTKEPGKVIVMENLKITNMTKTAKPKKNEQTGKWLKNGASQKTGLNRAILSIGWYKLESFTKYKSQRRGCLFVKISPQYTSQECADCGHIHSENRVSQAKFVCQSCGHRDNADVNAANVLKKRAITLIHSGAELSSNGFLSLQDTGRGAINKTRSRNGFRARGNEASKNKGTALQSLVLEASPL